MKTLKALALPVIILVIAYVLGFGLIFSVNPTSPRQPWVTAGAN